MSGIYSMCFLCWRFNSKSPASVCNGPPKTAGQNHWMESEWPVTPHWFCRVK